ncbi:Gfo/Idh/MocA family protein [Marinomonas sp. IMCC 4694]|uniref:Gfo/Idh/MocA family protein n=1 Tax=Marinomonas sp. IMCC 4694 TaxID=2605432 RepID=UPI0011E621A9|nr:Gfo/Idh/MocA family oxidoreductase [Marinomonas sp. IMCC 4694]TYL46968.1 Gfo/Idh/MocA family oxidoreductase [Marinomonas sp. IMCC 4694]
MSIQRAPLRWGMIGGGEGAFIGEVHRFAARLDNQYQLVAGALSTDPERNKRSAQALGLSRSYDCFYAMASAESALEDGVQVVSIVTPNFLHAPVAKAFLEKGIHVICDKPMTATLTEALELRAIAQGSKAAFLLTHNYSAYPLIREAQAMVANAELGQLRSVQVRYAQDWLTLPLEQEGNKQAAWRTDKSQSGLGGSLGDIGTHAYQLATFIMGSQANAVLADLSAWGQGRELDDEANVLLRFDNGVKGHLWASQVAPGNENNLAIELYGDKASLRWCQEQPNQLEFTRFGEPTQRLTRGSGYLSSAAQSVTRIPAGHPEGYLEAFATLYNAFSRQLDSATEQTLPSVDDGVQGLAFITAAVRSHEQGNVWVSLQSVIEQESLAL